MTRAAQALRIVAETLQPAAGGAPGAARRRALGDWTKPLALANAHFLAPAMYASLAQAGGLADLPPDASGYLELLYRLNRERNLALQRQTVELCRALNTAGVVPLLLKGGLSLFAGVYRDRAARMIRDIDILVPAEQVGAAVKTMSGLGYELIARYETGHNAYGDFARPHDPGAVDLHVELVEMPYLLPASDVWARSRRIEAEPGAVFAAPGAGDAALHHLLHAQVHHLGNFYRGVLELRQLHEFALLIDGRTDIDWMAMRDRLARHRLATVLESYALAAQRLFDCRWPLPEPPSKRAVLQCQRGLVQLCWPVLARIGMPLANITAAFAWHRMRQLYASGSLTGRRLRHAVQFIQKKSARYTIGRLFRTQ